MYDSDFDYESYKYYNKDLINISNNDLKRHYLNIGKNENRIYKVRLPKDFDIDLYKTINKDLNYLKSDSDVIRHYLLNGVIENRSYNNKNEIIYEKNIRKYKNIKISIVMAYYNRINQVKCCLNQIEYLYKNKYDLEVIIVDDKSDKENEIDNIIKEYDINIKLIKLCKKDWINPCIPYNIGFSKCTGNIIIIQNPEILHTNDIIKVCIDKLKNSNNYITFPVFSSPSYKYNEKLKYLQENNCKDYYKKFIRKINLKKFMFDYEYYMKKYKLDLSNEEAFKHWISIGINKNYKCNKAGIYYNNDFINKSQGWYNHAIYNNKNYHFLSAMNRDILDKIGGFCEKFKDGYWYEDDDLIYRISKITNIECINSKKYMGIHMYHDKFINEFDDKNKELILKNKNIFKENIINNVILCKI